MNSANYMTREEAIAKCEKAQPDRYEYNMFSYSSFDQETMFKCKSCGHRFLATPESIWRKHKTKCSNPSCKTA
jgi:hypothetical protein